MKYKKIISTIITATMLATTFVSLADPFQKIALAASTSSTYSGDDLGCTYTKEKTTFKVWAPTASKVTLKRYATGSDNASKEAVEPKSLGNVQMTKDDKTGVWTAVVEGDIKNTYYTYDVDGRETQDIYSKSTGVNGDRSLVIDLDSTNPEGWENDKRVDSPNQTDAVVWEVHIKDFSYDKNSGISDKNRGKYLAFTEQGTKYSGTDIKTGIDHLKELGVTHVQILPMYDYASVDEAGSDDQFNWGYDPKNFNTPEGSYSSNPYDGNARVTELKEMVQALHNAGIGVIMDVVYNHSYAPFGQGGKQNDFQKSQKSAFDMTVPGYYYTSTDWSGCGNSFDTTKPMYRKFVVDSMKYWAEEYHLDGFRFDLMGIIDNQTLTEVRNELNKIDPQIKIWGEPWCGDGSKNSMAGYGNKANIKNLDSNIAVFSDNARDAIKGNTWDGKLSNNGWVEGNSSRQTEVIAGIKAMCGDYDNVNKNIWSKQPSQVVTYTSCHDNHALYDMLCMATNRNQNGQRDDQIVNMNKLAASLVLTSQGISFMQAGEEFGRSKLGDHNSYQSSPNINKLDWSRLETFSDLNSYYTGLIKIRNNFSAFRDPTYNAANRIQWLSTPSASQIAYSLSNNVKGEWSKVVCLFNSNTSESSTINLPSGNWTIVANDKKAGTDSLGTASDLVTLPASSAMILVDKSSFDTTVIADKGTVTVKCVDEDGNSIAKDTTMSGKQGTKFEATAPEIEGYDLVNAEEDVKTGTYTEKDQTVTFIYKKDTTPRGTVTVKCIDVETNKEIQADTVTTKKVGTSYKIDTPKVAGYTLDDTYMPKNAEGTYTDSNIDVVYYFLKASETEVPDSITIHYYNANNWATPSIYAYLDGKTATELTGKWPGTAMTKDSKTGWYTFTIKARDAKVIINDGTAAGEKEPAGIGAPGYDCTAGDINIENGKATENTVDVPNKYIVRSVYVDAETNEEISPSTVEVLEADKEYTTKALDVDGYKLSETPKNAEGTVKDKNILVTYKYDKDEQPPVEEKGKVIVSYVDEDGNTIKKSTTITGIVGKSYTITPAEIDGYKLKETPDNIKGKFTKEDQKVVLVYSENEIVDPEIGKVIVKYLDKDTKEAIADNEIFEGNVGETYKVSAKDIDGYKLVEVPDNEEGIYEENSQTVTYYYTKNSTKPEDPKPEDPDKPGTTTPEDKPSKPDVPDSGDITEPDQPGEDKPGEDKPGEDKPGEDKPGEDKPGGTYDANSVIMMLVIMSTAVVVLKKFARKNN